ncbi:amino acid ABC transporter substrate-binding protein [Salinarimonas rosea]|uniref:amino acid ABC transporter substrate-binding protein n=1 Tax=Salinarimonas rosea TaxID=552063 RepID=UPI000425A954|nr:amino acid ABC transporter substrate-binding protein [Salinarimonas rosea]
MRRVLRNLALGACALGATLAAGAGAQAQELYGTLAKIDAANEIVIGHRETSIPFSWIGSDGGAPQGYSVDLCLRIADAVKEELGKPDLAVRFVPVTPQTRIPLIANGTIDIECGSTTNNLTRQQQVSYLPVTFITGTKLLVKTDAGIETLDDLEGKRIALAQGTTNERVIKEAIEAGGLDIDVLNVKDHAEGFLALETDRVDAYSTDHILLYGLITRARDPESYAVVGDFLSYDPYAIMVRRDDSAFQLLGTKVLADLFRTGEIEEIYAKWFQPFPTNESVSEPPTDLLRAAWRLNALPE